MDLNITTFLAITFYYFQAFTINAKPILVEKPECIKTVFKKAITEVGSTDSDSLEEKKGYAIIDFSLLFHPSDINLITSYFKAKGESFKLYSRASANRSLKELQKRSIAYDKKAWNPKGVYAL